MTKVTIGPPPKPAYREVTLVMDYQEATNLRDYLGRNTTANLRGAGVHSIWQALYNAGVGDGNE